MSVANRLKAFASTYGRAIVRDALRWRPGRQGTGYDKMLLFQSPFPVPCDGYLLRYPEGAEIPPHKDPAPPGKRHFRVNVVLKRSPAGGEFVATSAVPALFTSRRLNFFRSDLCEHAVTRVVGGSRYVLSFGWLA